MRWIDRYTKRRERTNPHTEEVLWQLSGLPPKGAAQAADAPIDDAAIQRYRRGEMGAEESRRLETRLAADDGGLQRLAQVAAGPAESRRPMLRIAASILVAAVATTGLFVSLRTDNAGHGSIPSFTIEVEGLAQRRGAATVATLETQLGSTVRILARPEAASDLDLDFALYRLESDALVSLPEAANRVRVERGTAVLETEASTLVGGKPGLYHLLLLIGPPGLEAPAGLSRAGLDALIGDSGAQAHTFELRLLRSDGGRAADHEPWIGGVPLPWKFYAEGCPNTLSLFSRSCGAYGDLHFVVFWSSCGPFDSGWELPFGYGGPGVKDPAITSVPRGGPTPPGAAPPPNRTPTSGPWVATIDWQDFHGEAVSSVVSTLAGPELPNVSYYVDDPSLWLLGSDVGDQHVLSKLCDVAEDVDTGSADLLALGMSLGRMQQPTDPVEGDSCSGTLGCHIRGLMDHLRDRGVAIAAAAGNHQDLLFPAVLDETLAVGGVDFAEYLETGALDPTWESPSQYDAILPGHGLCVGGAETPSGSSLSTAFLTGGLARLLDAMPGVDPYAAGPWVTQWSTSADCMVLAQGGVEHSHCNPGIEAVLGGIVQGPGTSSCWDPMSPERIAESAPPGSSEVRPYSLGLPQWIALNYKPAPPENPCLPCTDDDSYPPFQDNLVLNLTRSKPLSSSVTLDSLFLRTGDSFYPIVLSADDMSRFASAELDGLKLTGFDSVLEPGNQPSLFYVLKTNPDQGCLDEADGDPLPDSAVCYWHSTSVMP